MQTAFRSETSHEHNGTRKMRALVEELESRVALIDADIAEEERRTSVYDLAQPTYSILARNLRGRRDNLLVTIAILKRQLGSERQAA